MITNAPTRPRTHACLLAPICARIEMPGNLESHSLSHVEASALMLCRGAWICTWHHRCVKYTCRCMYMFILIHAHATTCKANRHFFVCMNSCVHTIYLTVYMPADICISTSRCVNTCTYKNAQSHGAGIGCVHGLLMVVLVVCPRDLNSVHKSKYFKCMCKIKNITDVT
jgi:hypothetical protein